MVCRQWSMVYRLLHTSGWRAPTAVGAGEKAKRLLGWTLGVGLEEGLRKTMEWYQNYLEHQA